MLATKKITEEILEFNHDVSQVIKSLCNIEMIKLGFCTKRVLYQEDKVILYHYYPRVEHRTTVPLLIVFALINRPDILDVDEKLSVIKMFLESGIDVYLIDWGYPDKMDCSITFEKYLTGYLKNCVEFVRHHTLQKRINILGICQGGVFSLCYTSLYPQHIKNIITIVTPVDFHTKNNILSKLLRYIDIDLMVDKFKNIPGHWLAKVFISLNPYQLLVKKYLDLIDFSFKEQELKQFLCIEKWISDTPDQAGETFRKFVKQFYQQNKLIKGDIIIENRQVNLQRVTMPVLNIVASNDYLIPPSACLPLKMVVGTKDYSVVTITAGHIGIYISAKVRGQLATAIICWLLQRT
jgi:polyhydroxyalkanoate synthase subunit PhaC